MEKGTKITRQTLLYPSNTCIQMTKERENGRFLDPPIRTGDDIVFASGIGYDRFIQFYVGIFFFFFSTARTRNKIPFKNSTILSLGLHIIVLLAIFFFFQWQLARCFLFRFNIQFLDERTGWGNGSDFHSLYACMFTVKTSRAIKKEGGNSKGCGGEKWLDEKQIPFFRAFSRNKTSSDQIIKIDYGLIYAAHICRLRELG